ncbi:MAG: VCBS repeat-containing protein, partial [Deltaproteobacteria bacterium]|nr:VCBS repeat-containing protein [Deltaproteobacteria bacterium]
VLYLNNGNGGFKDVGGALGVDSPLSGMGVAIGDYDNDGGMDIFSTYNHKISYLLHKHLTQNCLY